jgi:hypothetical protein
MRVQDPLHGVGIIDERNDPHRPFALGALQGIRAHSAL